MFGIHSFLFSFCDSARDLHIMITLCSFYNGELSVVESSSSQARIEGKYICDTSVDKVNAAKLKGSPQ